MIRRGSRSVDRYNRAQRLEQPLGEQPSRQVRPWKRPATRREPPVSKNHGADPIKDLYSRVAERRGRNKARVAAARKLLTLVYYGLRDGEIRSLVPPEAT